MDQEKYFDEIEAYLSGQQSTTEKAAFEKRMTTDAKLRSAVDLHRQAAASLGDPALLELAQKLKQVDENWKMPTEAAATSNSDAVAPTTLLSRLRVVRLPIAVAVSIALLIAFFQWFPRTTSSNPEQLFAQHFDAYPMVLNQRSALDTLAQAQLSNRAIQAYLQEDYQKAATAFQELQTLEEQPLYRFYEAVALLGDGEAGQSIPLLEKVLLQGDDLLVQQARWYLAMAWLKEGQGEKAREVLAGIKEGEYQWAAAQKVLAGF